MGEVYHQAVTVEQLDSIINFVEANTNVTLNNITMNNETVAALLERFARSENAKVTPRVDVTTTSFIDLRHRFLGLV